MNYLVFWFMYRWSWSQGVPLPLTKSILSQLADIVYSIFSLSQYDWWIKHRVYEDTPFELDVYNPRRQLW